MHIMADIDSSMPYYTHIVPEDVLGSEFPSLGVRIT